MDRTISLYNFCGLHSTSGHVRTNPNVFGTRHAELAPFPLTQNPVLIKTPKKLSCSKKLLGKGFKPYRTPITSRRSLHVNSVRKPS